MLKCYKTKKSLLSPARPMQAKDAAMCRIHFIKYFLFQEINGFEETTNANISKDSYAKTLHQIFVSLDVYRRPVLATENEDFVANVNRKVRKCCNRCVWVSSEDRP